ncbi:LOW QUALITY PROTEIN: cadherin-89D-like [Argopecten irradians]|uniref:LOW QUALITY PROTEIN: cadherin-89D-like n=1 Tax=Argopecten irradians TaxID=31199 RepID=UPI003711B044
MEIRVVVLGLIASMVESTTTTDPCSIPRTGYESFITDVPEDTPVGTVLGKLKVSGGPDMVKLTQQPNAFLHLDPASRNITLQMALDTDQGTSTIILKIECSVVKEVDLPSIPLMVRVILEDINDNPPLFSHSNYVVNVTEDTKLDKIIFGGAVATDADQKGGGNDQISYRIIPGPYSDYFDIEYPLYPDIKIRKPLDFETLNMITVVIEAKDNPIRGLSMSSSATLTINVIDTDDLIPTFTTEYYNGKVNINATRGTLVNVKPPIRAEDQDQLNTTVIYQMYDPSSRFLMNETTGAITVDSKLAAKTYSALLKATQVDNPLRYGIALIQISVAGLNITLPNGPSFRQNLYETTIAESQPPGTTVLTVPVTVRNPAGALSFNIMENIAEFAVDQRGNIFLTRTLDYDGSDKEYRFTLEVTDGKHMATTPIHIRIATSNVNDNNPQLQDSEFTVVAKRTQGGFVTTIEGQDNDPNTRLHYRLRTHTSLFAINSVGDITITAAPSELGKDSYLLVVNVDDDGVPKRSTIALVTVKFARHMLASQGLLAIGGTDLLAVIFGAVSAVLLIIVVILLVHIIRWKMAYTNKKLTKVRQQNEKDPKGLTYKSGKPPSDLDNNEIKPNGDIKKIPNKDIPTNIRENPLSEDKLHYGFTNISKEGNDDLRINTTVIPYGNSFNNYEERRAYQNDVLKTFHVPDGSSSGESSDSTGDSHRGLMKVRPSHSTTNCRTNNLSWGGIDRSNSYHWEENLPQDMRKSLRKPKIAVYF